jgi:hypothetical protein
MQQSGHLHALASLALRKEPLKLIVGGPQSRFRYCGQRNSTPVGNQTWILQSSNSIASRSSYLSRAEFHKNVYH